ncbi:putative mitochondrial protein [Tanacetum coccineum]
MPSQTRSSGIPVLEDSAIVTLRDSLMALMREEMDKLKAEIRNNAAETNVGTVFMRIMGNNVTWPVYKEGILQRYGLAYDHPAEIKKLKQIVTVKEIQTNEKGNDNMWNPLLKEYEDVFAVPTTLPPQRTCDHKIPLKEGTQPINIRPYRHPPTQKDDIEVMVNELLESRAVEQQTIKDKFHVPIIEELIDELYGAMIFSKLDLRSGYHQIRMYQDDIAKTTFKTHEGHYEFLVMPFGLTNAPSTFQALMNEVFRPFLRRFTLVFFDDILVHSSSVKLHEEHLRMVLQTLRIHKLFAKQNRRHLTYSINIVYGTTG